MANALPLSGMRVFELTLAIAGTTCGRHLAHFGAEVVKIESVHHPDINRTMGSTVDRQKYGDRIWLDSSILGSEFNTGKLSVGLDLKKPEARVLACRILSRCDVFLTNYSAEAVRSLGLDYESVRAIRPDIIYAGMTGFSADPVSPYYSYIAFGSNLAALCGLDELTGFPGSEPSGIASLSYADYVNGTLALVAILSALEHRDRTGEGQAIDLSQFEAVVTLLGPQLLDLDINRRSATRTGNRASHSAPQGVYRCRGKDDWVAISVMTQSEWRAFCHVAEHDEWAADDRFATLQQRLAHHDDLDALIEAWTIQHTPAEIAEWLQRVGVAASQVMNQAHLAVDAHLCSRDHWLLLDHARMGKDLVTGEAIRLSDTPGHLDHALPSIGQHNEYVLRALADCSGAEIEQLIADDVVFPMASLSVKMQRPYVPWFRHFVPQLPWEESSGQ